MRKILRSRLQQITYVFMISSECNGQKSKIEIGKIKQAPAVPVVARASRVREPD